MPDETDEWGESAGAVISVEIAEPSPPTLQDRQGNQGSCAICGEPTRRPGARGTAPKYCELHRQTTGSVHAGPKVGRSKKTASSASNSDLASSLGKLLAIITLVIAWAQLRARKIPDANGDIAERIAFSDEEAVAIARPLARTINSTNAGMRVGKQLVDNSDLIDAGFALAQWYKRMNETLDAAASGRPQGSGDRGISRPSEQNQPVSSGGIEPDYDFV